MVKSNENLKARDQATAEIVVNDASIDWLVEGTMRG
jgi:hypothetical protein